MRTAAALLSDLATSPHWPARWMTVAEIAAELERRGFWEAHDLAAPTGAARLEVLRGLLSEGRRAWVQRGPLFKHAALLTDEDRALLADGPDDGLEALNEDLGRILLGEGCGSHRDRRKPGLKEVLRQARPLVEELARLARQMEWQAEGVPPQARRFRNLAASLADLMRRHNW
jgi:hypothetical protein